MRIGEIWLLYMFLPGHETIGEPLSDKNHINSSEFRTSIIPKHTIFSAGEEYLFLIKN